MGAEWGELGASCPERCPPKVPQQLPGPHLLCTTMAALGIPVVPEV